MMKEEENQMVVEERDEEDKWRKEREKEEGEQENRREGGLGTPILLDCVSDEQRLDPCNLTESSGLRLTVLTALNEEILWSQHCCTFPFQELGFGDNNFLQGVSAVSDPKQEDCLKCS